MKSLSSRKQFFTRRKLVIGGLLILIILVGICFYMYQQNKNYNEQQLSTVEKNYVSNEDKKKSTDSSSQNKSSTTPSSDEKTIPSNATVDSGAVPEKPNITRAEQSGDSIRVSAIFTQATNGKCILKLEKNGSTITKEADIIIGASYYTCNGFRIPRSEIPTSGEWQASVTHSLNGKTSDTEVKIINVQ